MSNAIRRTFATKGSATSDGTPRLRLHTPAEEQTPQHQTALVYSRPAFKEFVDRAGIQYDEDSLVHIGFAEQAVLMMKEYGWHVMEIFPFWEEQVIRWNCEAHMADWFNPDGTRRSDELDSAGMSFEEWVTENGGSFDRHALTFLLMAVYVNLYETEEVDILFDYDEEEKTHVMWVRFDGEEAYTGYFC